MAHHASPEMGLKGMKQGITIIAKVYSTAEVKLKCKKGQPISLETIIR